MRALRSDRFGEPGKVLRCDEIAEPRPPEAGEVSLAMLAMPINPADLLMVQGRYGGRPTMPHIYGSEGVARVTALGEGVDDVHVGDLVIPLATSTFVDRMTTKAANLIKLPAGTDPLQAAMLKANPATAELLLSEVAPLVAGNWIIQNAANSSVGQYICRLAKLRQIRTINVVRRTEASRVVSQAGGDVVLIHDGADTQRLAQEVARATTGEPVKLAIDAIGGSSTNALAAAIGEGQRVVNYGLLSGKPCEIDAAHLIFRGVTLVGFWLASWFRTTSRDSINALYQRLAMLAAQGTIRSEIAATYPLEQFAQAMQHAERAERDGKVLLVTNQS